MTQLPKRILRRRALKALCATGIVCQLGSCNLNDITTTTTMTLDGREVIISLVRQAILTPIDQYITEAVNELFDDDVD